MLILCNSLGTPIDSKYMDVEPVFVSMSTTHIAAASHNCVYVWNFTSAKVRATFLLLQCWICYSNANFRMRAARLATAKLANATNEYDLELPPLISPPSCLPPLGVDLPH